MYAREDIDYSTFYTPWMRMLALNNTKAELERMLGVKHAETPRAARSHLSAIEASCSPLGRSQQRAQTRNVLAAIGDTKIAIRGALEIYELFPECTKEFCANEETSGN